MNHGASIDPSAWKIAKIYKNSAETLDTYNYKVSQEGQGKYFKKTYKAMSQSMHSDSHGANFPLHEKM